MNMDNFTTEAPLVHNMTKLPWAFDPRTPNAPLYAFPYDDDTTLLCGHIERNTKKNGNKNASRGAFVPVIYVVTNGQSSSAIMSVPLKKSVFAKSSRDIIFCFAWPTLYIVHRYVNKEDNGITGHLSIDVDAIDMGKCMGMKSDFDAFDFSNWAKTESVDRINVKQAIADATANFANIKIIPNDIRPAAGENTKLVTPVFHDYTLLIPSDVSFVCAAGSLYLVVKSTMTTNSGHHNVYSVYLFSTRTNVHFGVHPLMFRGFFNVEHRIGARVRCIGYDNGMSVIHYAVKNDAITVFDTVWVDMGNVTVRPCRFAGQNFDVSVLTYRAKYNSVSANNEFSRLGEKNICMYPSYTKTVGNNVGPRDAKVVIIAKLRKETDENVTRYAVHELSVTTARISNEPAVILLASKPTTTEDSTSNPIDNIRVSPVVACDGRVFYCFLDQFVTLVRTKIKYMDKVSGETRNAVFASAGFDSLDQIVPVQASHPRRSPSNAPSENTKSGDKRKKKDDMETDDDNNDGVDETRISNNVCRFTNVPSIRLNALFPGKYEAEDVVYPGFGTIVIRDETGKLNISGEGIINEIKTLKRTVLAAPISVSQ